MKERSPDERLQALRASTRSLYGILALTFVAAVLDGLTGSSGRVPLYAAVIYGGFIWIAIASAKAIRLAADALAAADHARPAPDPAGGAEASVASGSTSSTAPLVVMASGLAVAALIVALTAVGFNNAYSYEVVDQQARQGTMHERFTGAYSIEYDDAHLCNGGNDYLACAYMHVAMFNSVCADRVLTPEATATCEELEAFNDDVRRRADTCGQGCTTQVGDSGTWGWAYIYPVAEIVIVSSGDALPRIAHDEYCYFELGSIRLGKCPGRESVG